VQLVHVYCLVSRRNIICMDKKRIHTDSTDL
jgi:hypothetical protein